MKSRLLIIVPLLLLPLSCSARDDGKPSAQAVQDAIAHYFTTKASVSRAHRPSFVTGDFNGDGITDMAVLFRPAQSVAGSAQVQISTP